MSSELIIKLEEIVDVLESLLDDIVKLDTNQMDDTSSLKVDIENICSELSNVKDVLLGV